MEKPQNRQSRKTILAFRLPVSWLIGLPVGCVLYLLLNRRRGA
jgi:hypothetical protein